MPSSRNPHGSTRPTCDECGTDVAPDANFCPACGANLDAAPSRFCSSCGSRFAPEDAFCSDCGAERNGVEHLEAERADVDAGSVEGDATSSDDDSNADTDGVTTEDPTDGTSTFRRSVQRHLDAGWEITRDEGHTVVVVDRDIGSIPIHVLLLLTTGGAGNILYGYYHHSMLAETRRLSDADDHYPMPKRTPETETTVTTTSAYALSAVVLLVGLFIAVVAAGSGSLAMAAAGAVLAVAGLSVAPPVAERLGRRHEVTAFGRRRTVDHRILEPVDPAEEPCVVCDRTFDGGIVRRRRDETLLAGVPIRTHEHERNHYCAACAREELLGIDDATASSADVETSLDELSDESTTVATGDPVSESAAERDG